MNGYDPFPCDGTYDPADETDDDLTAFERNMDALNQAVIDGIITDIECRKDAEADDEDGAR